MGPVEGRSDHRWGPRAGDSTMCKPREDADRVRLGTAGGDIEGPRAGGLVVRPQRRWTLLGRRSWGIC
jgi:hypothetical protein